MLEEPKTSFRINVCGATDIGRSRENNEDYYAIYDFTSDSLIASPDSEVDISSRGTLLIVSDGMGGANAGEIASKMATEVIIEELKKYTQDDWANFAADHRSFLEKAAREAHLAIIEDSKNNKDRKGMGATVTALWLCGNEGTVVQVGDSRLYRLEHDKISRITHDQSPVGRMLRSGHLTAEQARLHPQRNLLDQALGAGLTEIAPDSDSFPIHSGESYLLCSDGLSDGLPDSQIYNVYTELSPCAPSVICSRLIQEADNRYGQDNITALLCHIL